MFDSIDKFYQEETAETLLVCLGGSQPLSLLVLWTHEQERKTPDYTLQAPSRPLNRDKVTVIFRELYKRVNARGQDLLVIQSNEKSMMHLMYTVTFLHFTVKEFLLEPDMLRRLERWASKNFDAKATLCKAIVVLVKSLPTSTWVYSGVLNMRESWQEYFTVDPHQWRKHVKDFFTYAHLIEQEKRALEHSLVDELQRVVSSFRRPPEEYTRWELFLNYLASVIDRWARWIDEDDDWPINDLALRLLSPDDKDMAGFFCALAVDSNMKSYIRDKLKAAPRLIKRSFSKRPMLDRALQPPLRGSKCHVNPDMVQLLLSQGADPNEEFTVYISGGAAGQVLTESRPQFFWTTVWGRFLQRLYQEKCSGTRKPPAQVACELEATKILIEHGAVADLRPWRVFTPQRTFDGFILTPSDIFREVFPPGDADTLDQLMRRYRPWAAQEVCSSLRRTILLWFYRDIFVIYWLTTSLSRSILAIHYLSLPKLILRFLAPIIPVIFNPLTGVIFPMIIVPWLLFLLWLVLSRLVWPLVWFFVSSADRIFVWTFVRSFVWRFRHEVILVIPKIFSVISYTVPVVLLALILNDWMPSQEVPFEVLVRLLMTNKRKSF